MSGIPTRRALPVSAGGAEALTIGLRISDPLSAAELVAVLAYRAGFRAGCVAPRGGAR